ncbi:MULTISPECIES: GNAT family N-acetyltransferase [unclassified Crossiella]|uniref:GNAT family N-acetyltransferase n=1 Tax=unclassified Crossiella TaxID=2620835 RepID=UPI001FFEEA2C|nr:MULTISPECIES: GNAT family N-acetyltransferase [unclassified Crossiella]MCK2238732.1 GNAT family N-acetyltransferase [Crossiella sp. S99.2]MCK2251698.1 GNAT family N-acetyltransferase [Crossiella sp. S99.1]
MIAPTTPFERLTPADLPACTALALDREWPREERKWRFLMGVGEVHALRAPDGGLAGTVVLTRYRAELIAVSMVLVAARFARQGLGKRLMRHAIDQADGATLALTATVQASACTSSSASPRTAGSSPTGAGSRPNPAPPGTAARPSRPTSPRSWNWTSRCSAPTAPRCCAACTPSPNISG